MTLLLSLAAQAATFDAPEISAPVDGAVIADPTPELRLDQVAGLALSYHVHVETLDGVPLLDGPATLDGTWASLQLVEPLAEDTWTCWYGVASDGVEEAVSDTACFFMTTTNDPPSAPVWEVGEIVGTEASVQIQHGVDAEQRGEWQLLALYSETGVLLDQTELQTAGPGTSGWALSLEEDHLYRLRAQASDGLRLSEPSEVWILASDINSAPSVPVLVSPKEGVSLEEQPVLVLSNSADPEADALRYDFELLDSTGEVILSATDIQEGEDRSAWTPEEPLEEGAYSWRAQAVDAGGAESGWSAPAEFWMGPVGETSGLESSESGSARVGYAGGGGCSSLPGGRGLSALGLLAVLGLVLRRRR